MMNVCMTNIFNMFLCVSAGSNYSCAVVEEVGMHRYSFHQSLCATFNPTEMSAEADVRKMHYSQLSISDEASLSLSRCIYLHVQYANLNECERHIIMCSK